MSNPSADPHCISEPSLLEIDLKRLRNSLLHLEASNRELKALLQEDRDAGRPLDPDYKEAFNENIVIIAKQRAQIEKMEQELARLAASSAAATAALKKGTAVASAASPAAHQAAFREPVGVSVRDTARDQHDPASASNSTATATMATSTPGITTALPDGAPAQQPLQTQPPEELMPDAAAQGQVDMAAVSAEIPSDAGLVSGSHNVQPMETDGSAAVAGLAGQQQGQGSTEDGTWL